MSASDVLEGELLDHLFNIDAYTAPATWIGLSTADPGDDALALAEPSGNGYARVQVTAWSRTDNEVDNDSALTFTEASGDWGTITHACIFDAETDGNLLISFALDSSVAITISNTTEFSAGSGSITYSNSN